MLKTGNLPFLTKFKTTHDKSKTTHDIYLECHFFFVYICSVKENKSQLNFLKQ